MGSFEQLKPVEPLDDKVENLPLDELLRLASKVKTGDTPIWDKIQEVEVKIEEGLSEPAEIKGWQEERAEVLEVLIEIEDRINLLKEDEDILSFALDNSAGESSGQLWERIDTLTKNHLPTLRKIISSRQNEVTNPEDLQNIKDALSSVRQELSILELERKRLESYIYSPEEIGKIQDIKKALSLEKEKSLDIEQEKALEYIERLVEDGADKGSVAIGLAGLDSSKAWDMREDLLKQGADKDWVARGLAGLDSSKAWDMREDLLKQGADKDWVAIGLAGLDSSKAWDMREDLLKQGANKGWVARGVYGDYLMAGVRKARRDSKK